MHLLDQGEFDNGICLGMSMFTCTTAVYRENGKDSEIMQFIYPKFKELRERVINNLCNMNNKKTQKYLKLKKYTSIYQKIQTKILPTTDKINK